MPQPCKKLSSVGFNVVRTAALAAALMICSTPAAAADSTPRVLTPGEKAAIKAAVDDKLKDPSSAQFKWGKWNRSPYYCAAINAKNSYGGYIGFVPFLALVAFADGKSLGTPFVMLADADPDSPTSRTIRGQCAEGGYPPQ